MYFPKKYFSGLSRTQKKKRMKEIKKFGKLHWKNPKAYAGFKTDKDPHIKRKSSSYTLKWKSLYPHSKGLESASKITGVPLGYLKECYNRGMGAWRTGHRPGATEQQWGYARVYSMLLCGKTYHTTDSDIVKKSMKQSKSARKWFTRKCK